MESRPIDHGSIGAREAGDVWRDPVWIYCRDGKYRPIPRAAQPSAFEMADGSPSSMGRVRLASGVEVYTPLIEKGKARVGRLKGYGNAICAPQAQAFIEAFMEITLADHLLSTPADDITVSNSHGHHPNHPRRNPL